MTEYISTKYRYAHGSVEGRLLQLSAITERHSCTVVDQATGNAVTCYFTDQQLEEHAEAAYKGRVSVSGKIKYNRAGEPVSMEVADLKKLMPDDELPQLSDLLGINITGGRDAVEYISNKLTGG